MQYASCETRVTQAFDESLATGVLGDFKSNISLNSNLSLKEVV